MQLTCHCPMHSMIDPQAIAELPGADIILPGVRDLKNGTNNSIGALLVTIAATRLTQAGLAFPRDNLVKEPELTLYAQLEAERDDAYSYYNALLDSLNSFCNALDHYRTRHGSTQAMEEGSGHLSTELT